MPTSFAIWDYLLVLTFASAVLVWCWRFPHLVRASWR